jgi:predicted hotdog family 3-hydroxylacyl-ACP dehydratase
VSVDAFPPIEALVPHAAGMLLLDRVLSHEATRTVCATSADRSPLFANPDGSVPSWVGIEYMAQCAAVHGTLAHRSRGEAPRPGLLLGSRRLELHADAFAAGDPLEVVARHHRGDSGLVAFDCSIRSPSSGETLVEGRVNLYLFRDWSEVGEVGG